MKIVIVDDFLWSAKLLERFLAINREEQDEVTLLVPKRSEDIVAKINALKPDIVFIDISLKLDKNGIEIGKELKDTKVVVMTARSDEEIAKLDSPFQILKKIDFKPGILSRIN